MISVFTNMALLSFRTDRVADLWGGEGDKLQQRKLIVFFLGLLFVFAVLYLLNRLLGNTPKMEMMLKKRQIEIEKFIVIKNLKSAQSPHPSSPGSRRNTGVSAKNGISELFDVGDDKIRKRSLPSKSL